MNAISADMTNSFTPDQVDARALRDAFGQFATGVTVVTCDSEDGPICITANSFSSLSLDPPLVMWAAGRTSRRFPYFRKARHFAVHVLSAEQSDICSMCSKDPKALRRISHEQSSDGVPLLPGCLARFECERDADHDAGDHVIMVGKVLRVGTGSGDALAFFAGKFGQFAPG
ncbi:MAG: flavin reductase family protein [Paracoccaceae bacterium]